MPGKDAKGCDIYNRAPCPMCTSAIYRSRIDHLYFGASLEDTSHIRFSDEFQYQDFTLPQGKRRLRRTTLGKINRTITTTELNALWRIAGTRVSRARRNMSADCERI
jgi:tRNA(Arg) A34 adenosine deaminase TadA